MNVALNSAQPSVIVRQQIPENHGVRSFSYSKNTLGYVEQGSKILYQGDRFVTVLAGEVFHLDSGVHFIENCPASAEVPYSEILFFYSTHELRNLPFQVIPPATEDHPCVRCSRYKTLCTYPAWPMLEAFFHSTGAYVQHNAHLSHPQLSHLKLCELVHLLLGHPSCCVAHSLRRALRERPLSPVIDVLRDHILKPASIERLARACEMTPSRFSRQVRRELDTTPLHWLQGQRMEHGRFLLMTTDRSVADISRECLFSAPSLFIRSFRNRYRLTPAAYRATHQFRPKPAATLGIDEPTPAES